MTDESRCKCGNEGADHLHGCPYQKELNDNHCDEHCNCCEECRSDCFNNI